MTLEKIQNGSKRPGRVKGMSCCWWVSMAFGFVRKK